MKKKRNGFTLVEILIVVIILGILAAIVIPQFSTASEDAKLSSLMSSLWTIRSQIQLYKMHHNSTLPGTTSGVTFVQAMTSYTTASGALAAIQAPAPGVYGPYLQKIPANPFNNNNDVVQGPVGEGPGDGTSGWYYDVTTGAFNASDNAAHAAL